MTYWLLWCFSDDRSVEVFNNRIEAATQMKAVMGADPRPNCLIIDEIDGAPQVNLVSTMSVSVSHRWEQFRNLTELNIGFLNFL